MAKIRYQIIPLIFSLFLITETPPKKKERYPFNTMDTIGVKGAVCMVCIVKNLELDVALLKNELRVRQIVNRAIGKTWSKPSKQKKHNTSNSHEVQHFCTSKHAVAKELHMWRLGLMPIGGVWCSAPNLWSSERLKVWLSEQTGGIKGVKVVKKKIVNVKRPLSNPFEIPAKKAKATHSSREKDLGNWALVRVTFVRNFGVLLFFEAIGIFRQGKTSFRL